MKVRHVVAAAAIGVGSFAVPGVANAQDVEEDDQAEVANHHHEDDKTGLWGLVGLLGLAGLAGLARKKDTGSTYVGQVPRQPPTTGGASSG
jgi:MYXO-CTERM domain-containing protein